MIAQVTHEEVETPFSVSMNCKHVPDSANYICWNCTVKIVNMAEATEAQRAELQRSIDGICEFYGTLSIVSAVATMHAERKQRDELAAQLKAARDEIGRLNQQLAQIVINSVRHDA